MADNMRAKIWDQWEKRFKPVNMKLHPEAPCCLITQGLLEQAGLDHGHHNEAQCLEQCHQETIKLSVREGSTPAGCQGRQACVITFCILESEERFALMTGKERLWVEEAPSETIAVLAAEKRSKAKKAAIARQLPGKEAEVAEKERQQRQKDNINRQPDGQSQAQGVQPHAPQHRAPTQGDQRQ